MSRLSTCLAILLAAALASQGSCTPLLRRPDGDCISPPLSKVNELDLFPPQFRSKRDTQEGVGSYLWIVSLDCIGLCVILDPALHGVV